MERRDSNRHLAAIMFTDIVGYTAMMQRDEHLALDLVRRHQMVLERMVPEHHGEIYQYYGDGSMSMFHSATQAVQCAFEIQKELLEEPVVHIRIGIHVGEVYTEGGKVFGDGVNIASRIESIGQGGAILFSRDVFEKVRNNTTFQIQSIGRYEFKNVDDPVEVFALTNPEVVTPDIKAIDGKLKIQPKKKKWFAQNLQYILSGIILILAAGYFLALKSSSKESASDIAMENKSIAVLPFKNLSEGQDEDFISTGLTVDIITQLASINDLKVISRSSSLRYKDSDKSIKTIARELGVTTILEGSVRMYDKNIRVSVQLTDGMNESLIWAEDFDREIEDVLNVQRSVALAVSDMLKIALTPEVKNRFEDTQNVDPEAYVHYQRGQKALTESDGTKEEMEEAIGYFELAIQKDSTFSKAWIGLADAWLESVFWHRTTNEIAIPKIRAAVLKALELDPDSGEPYHVLGSVNLIEKDMVTAEKNLRKALELNPNNAFSLERLAWVTIYRNRDEKEAYALFSQASQLDPHSTRYRGSFGQMYYYLRKFDKGIEIMESLLEKNPTDNFLLWSLAYLQAGKGQYHESIKSLEKRSIGTTTNWVLGYCYAHTGQTEKAKMVLNNNLEKVKRGEPVPDFMLAIQYNALGDKKKALEHLEMSTHTGGEGFFIIGLADDPMLKNLWNDPEFKRIVELVKTEYKL